MGNAVHKSELDRDPRPLTIEELWEIRGTPEFDIEYRRQAKLIGEHARHNRLEKFPTDWAALEDVWK